MELKSVSCGGSSFAISVSVLQVSAAAFADGDAYGSELQLTNMRPPKAGAPLWRSIIDKCISENNIQQVPANPRNSHAENDKTDDDRKSRDARQHKNCNRKQSFGILLHCSNGL